MRVIVDLSHIFTKSDIPIFKLIGSDISILLEKTKENEQMPSNATQSSAVHQLWSNLLQAFAMIIVKSIQIHFSKICIQHKERAFFLESFSFSAKRKKNSISTDLLLKEFVFCSKNFDIRIPQFKFAASSLSPLTKIVNLLNSKNNFYSIPFFKIGYKEGKTSINVAQIECSSPNGSGCNINIEIPKFHILMPKYDFHTKNFRLEAQNLTYFMNEIKSKNIFLERNSLIVAQIPSIFVTKYFCLIDDLLDIHINSTMIIDIGLLKRYFSFKSSNSESKVDSNNGELDFKIKAPNAKIKLFLSDNHVLHFGFRGFSLKKKVISAKRFWIDICANSILYRFLVGERGHFTFVRPYFGLECRSCNFFLTSEFAERSYIQEVFNLISFISKQFKGDISPLIRDSQPPTRRIFSLDFHKCSLVLKQSRLASQITKANEAKRMAMESLLLRQAKSIQILNANNSKVFNKDSFDSKSQEILFKLYRTAFKSIHKPPKTICQVDATDLVFTLNGPAIRNKDEAVSKIFNILPDIQYEPNIGRIFGGEVVSDISSLSFSTPKMGTFMSFQKFNTSGLFFNVKTEPKTKRDTFHFLITCDDNTIQFLVPGVSTRSVNIINLSFTSKKMHVDYSPLWSEMRQDLKLGTIIFRKKKFLFKRIRFFDNCRLRVRGNFSIKCDTFSIGYKDKRDPFSPNPLLTVLIPKFSLNFNGKEFIINGESVEVKYNLKNNGTFAILPRILIKMRVISFNPKNENGAHPVFIPIDGCRLNDPTYDPFERSRTYTYSATVNITFLDEGKAIFNFDYLQDFIDRFVFHVPISSTFVHPPYFVARPHPYPTFSYVDLNVTLPEILITYMKSTTTTRIYGSPIVLHFNNKEEGKTNLSVKSKQIHASLQHEALDLLTTTIDYFSFEKFGSNGANLSISSCNFDLSSRLIDHRHDFSLILPPKDKSAFLPDFETAKILMDHFTTHSMTVTIYQATIDIHLEKSRNKIPQIAFANLIYEKYGYINEESPISLHSIRVDSFVLFTVSQLPFVKLTGGEAKLTSVDLTHIKFIDVNSLELNLKPIDFEFFIPEFESYKNSEHSPRAEAIPHLSRLAANVKLLKLAFAQNDGTVLASAKISGLVAKFLKKIDTSSSTLLAFKKLTAKNETEKDASNMFIFETCRSEKPLFSLSIEKVKQLVKYPVFERIEIQFSPFILRIQKSFIKMLIKAFPTAEDLKLLYLDENEERDNDTNDERSYDEFDEEAVVINNDDNSAENMIFCREFIFKPFKAELNLRLKSHGIFSEFKDRPFNYKGLHIYDVYGSKKKLESFVKKNLKRTAIRSLPQMILGRRRDYSSASLTQEEEPDPS